MEQTEVNPNGVAVGYEMRKDTGRAAYVRRVQGDGGVDWEWCDHPHDAAMLSPYWQRRFRADRRRCGSRALFLHQ